MELALHSLVLSQYRPTEEDDAKGEIVARQLDALSVALDTMMTRLAISLRTLKPPLPVPALRPLQAALSGEPALADGNLLVITNNLVDAANTLDAILRSRLEVP